MTVDEPILLNLELFSTREEWINYARGSLTEGCRTVGSKYLLKGEPFTTAHMLFQAFISRARGLHEGSLREIEFNNPHGVFPLTRAFVELTGTLLYCLKKPHYIDVLVQSGSDKAKGRKSFEAILSATRKEAPGMKYIYKNLSEYSHFREIAIYNVQTPRDEDSGRISWTDGPHWRSDHDFKVACSQVAELQEAFVLLLEDFGQQYLVNFSEEQIIGRFT